MYFGTFTIIYSSKSIISWQIHTFSILFSQLRQTSKCLYELSAGKKQCSCIIVCWSRMFTKPKVTTCNWYHSSLHTLSHRGGQLTSQCFSPSSLQSKPATAIGGWDLIFILASKKLLAAHRSLNLYTGRMALFEIWDRHLHFIFLAFLPRFHHI